MHSPPIPRPKQSKYPTPDAYKQDAYFGSSYSNKDNSYIHFLKALPHYTKHVRAIQRGTNHQGAQVRDLYQGQFPCGGFAENNAAVMPLASAPVHCPASYPMKPVCQCKK